MESAKQHIPSMFLILVKTEILSVATVVTLRAWSAVKMEVASFIETLLPTCRARKWYSSTRLTEQD